MFKDKGTKRFYNFTPTTQSWAKPKYSKIKTLTQAKKIKKESERFFGKDRTWRIRAK